jgi:homoserine kinase
VRATEGITAFAPGGIGNVGPGLDILGLALEGDGDSVRAEWSSTPGISILEPGHPELPREWNRHTSGLAAAAVVSLAGGTGSRGQGIALSVCKGLPLSGGQGGSAASAVAAAVAVNRLLGSPLSRDDLIQACLTAEEAVSGCHADNIAPSLLGGIVLIRSMEPLDLVQLPVPEQLCVVIARPEQRLRTSDARSVLPEMIGRNLALHQAAQVAAIVAALANDDYELLGRAIDDRIAEPARVGLLPGFAEAKRAALEAGALGSSISGAGPAAFALVRGSAVGRQVAEAMQAAYEAKGQRCQAKVTGVDRRGARVVDSEGVRT